MSEKKILDKNIDNTSKDVNLKSEHQGGATPVAPDGLSASPQPVKVMSDRDSSIADLVKEQPTAEEVERLDLNATPGLNLLELPEECKALHGKKYRYRWMANDRFLEARLRSNGWVLCTRSNSPYIKPHRFKAHGAVEQAGMLLAFLPETLGKKREQAGAIKSRNLVKHYTEDLAKTGSKEKGGFYQPETAGSDEDDKDESGET